VRNPYEPDNNGYTENSYNNGNGQYNDYRGNYNYNNGYNNNGYNNGYENNYNNYQTFDSAYGTANTGAVTFSRHMAKTYLWMFFGLAITFGLALYMMLNSASVMDFVVNHYSMYLGAVVISIVFVFTIGFLVTKLPPTAAKIVFVLYAADMGILITPTLLMYELGSVVYVFGITSVLYLVLAIIGLTTKKDMTKFGVILTVALIGLLVYSLISFFFIHSTVNNLFIGCVGIIIFMGFTIYDNNRLKKQFNELRGNSAMLEKLSIISALSLYLDYVNLFLRLLALFGKRRD